MSVSAGCCCEHTGLLALAGDKVTGEGEGGKGGESVLRSSVRIAQLYDAS